MPDTRSQGAAGSQFPGAELGSRAGHTLSGGGYRHTTRLDFIDKLKAQAEAQTRPGNNDNNQRDIRCSMRSEFIRRCDAPYDHDPQLPGNKGVAEAINGRLWAEARGIA